MGVSGAGNALHSALKAAAMTHCRNSPGVAIGLYRTSMWSATKSSSRTKARHASLKLHYGERPAQRLVGYLDRTVKWHVHIQYQIHGSRDKH